MNHTDETRVVQRYHINTFYVPFFHQFSAFATIRGLLSLDNSVTV